MNPANIKTIYLKEMKESLRDRRTLISMIVIPIVLMPVLMIGLGGLMSKMVKQAQSATAQVMIINSDQSPALTELISKIERFVVVPPSSDFRDQISNEKIRAAVELGAGFTSKIEQGDQPELTIYYYEGEMKSESVARDIQKAVGDFRKELIRQKLVANNLSEKILDPFTTRQQNVAPEEKVSGQRFGGLFPYIIILMCLTGAIYPAIDLTAGEKERGTIETILVSAAGRLEIVLGKFLTVLTASAATGLLSLTSLAVTLTYGLSRVSDARELENLFKFTPLSLMLALLMMLPVTVLFSSALLAIALVARSYKEAQSYIVPLNILVVIPAFAAMLPGVKMDLGLALVPILGSSLIIKEILTQVYQWDLMAITFGVSTIYAAIALLVALAMFRQESVLFRT